MRLIYGSECDAKAGKTVFGAKISNLSLVQHVDIAALVELLDETEVDKVFGLRSLCFRVARQDCFQSFQSWILFRRQFMLGDRAIISSFEQLFVGQGQGLGQYFHRRFAVGLEAVYGLDMSFDVAAYNICPLTNEFSRCGDAGCRIRQTERSDVG